LATFEKVDTIFLEKNSVWNQYSSYYHQSTVMWNFHYTQKEHLQDLIHQVLFFTTVRLGQCLCGKK